MEGGPRRGNLEELSLTAAAEVPDDAMRAQFLETVRPARPAALKAGYVFRPGT